MAEDEGFVCIFAFGENRCLAAIQLAATKLPPAAWILFSNPYPRNKKYGYPFGYPYFLAEDEGFEPPQTESESGVLPLHKSSIAGTFIIIRIFLEMSRSFLKIFEISDKVILSPKGALYSSQGKGFPAKTWSFRYRKVTSSPSSRSMVSKKSSSCRVCRCIHSRSWLRIKYS